MTALLLGVALGGFAACAGSQPSRFYTLTTLRPPDARVESAPGRHRAVVAVGPVTIPGYLDRPQMVTRSDRNEVRIAEKDRWAGPLREDVSRVLVENLSVLLAGEPFVVLRWEQAVLSSVPVKYRVGVEVLRFEGTVGGTVLLRARYTIYDVDGAALSVRDSTLQEPASGPDYEALAAAMSRTLATASREIASAVRAE
jgi:uncharacterized lipoprotein YmbA